ncbi:hypothetical protein ACVWWG_005183 [Bradyrhizobium sp. LB7.2]
MQRRLSMAALALLFTCGASNAQTAVSSSGMGATSPLGMPGAERNEQLEHYYQPPRGDRD